MSRRLPKIFTVAALLAAVVLPAAAEDAIIFSKPAEADTKAKPDANLAPDTKHESRGLLNNLQRSLFEREPSPPPSLGGMVSAPPGPSLAQQQVWRQKSKQKDQWLLQTPAEISGILTLEQILRLPPKNSDDKLSLDERFLKQRMGMKAAVPAANDKEKPVRSDAPVAPPEGIFARHGIESVFARPGENNQASSAASGFKPFKNSTFVAAPKGDSVWANSFNLAATPPSGAVPQAGMNRVHQMFEPSAVLAKAAEPARPPTAFTPRRDTALDSGSPFNPHGSTFTPVRNNAEKPRGLEPLPGIATRPLVIPKRPASAPELPPWLREDGEKMQSPLKKF